MKFRGLMVDLSAMKELMGAVLSFSKLSKDCVLRLTTRNMFFIILESGGPKKPFVWCEMPVSFYFQEYTMSGLNEKYDEIYLSLDTLMLAKSLVTLKNNAKSLKMKLTNKQSPCITLEIEQTSGAIQNRQCVHDIPVQVIPKEEWCDYMEPTTNDFHVSILLPNLKSLKNIVDRMKSLSSSLIVAANKQGRLTLRIRTDLVTMSAHFPDLSVQSFAVHTFFRNETTVEEENEKVSTVIDIKKIMMFLSGMHLNNYKTTCSIVHNQMVKLLMEQPGTLSVRCYLSEMSN